MPIFNKLVRDHIPQVIQSSGKEYRTHILNEKEYEKELLIKLREEVEEYFSV